MSTVSLLCLCFFDKSRDWNMRTIFLLCFVFSYKRRDFSGRSFFLVTSLTDGCAQEAGGLGKRVERGWNHLMQVRGKGQALLLLGSPSSFPQCGQMWNLALWLCSPGTP
jgi:hypothetical protein